MSALTVYRRDLPVIERAAVRLGTILVAWGQRRAHERRESVIADSYRAEYAERVRDASAVVCQRLLP